MFVVHSVFCGEESRNMPVLKKLLPAGDTDIKIAGCRAPAWNMALTRCGWVKQETPPSLLNGNVPILALICMLDYVDTTMDYVDKTIVFVSNCYSGQGWIKGDL